jgi:hypothetical protein
VNSRPAVVASLHVKLRSDKGLTNARFFEKSCCFVENGKADPDSPSRIDGQRDSVLKRQNSEFAIDFPADVKVGSRDLVSNSFAVERLHSRTGQTTILLSFGE